MSNALQLVDAAVLNLKMRYTALVLFAAVLCGSFAYLIFKRLNVRGLPGPPHHILLGSLPVMLKATQTVPKDLHPQALMTVIQRLWRLGDFFFVDIWPLTEQMCVVTSPDLARQLTQVHPLPRHPMVTQYVRPLVGRHSMLISNGQKWRNLRGMFAPGFSSAYLMTLVPVMVDKTLIFCDALRSVSRARAVCQMEELAAKLTVDVIGQVVLDIDLNSQQSDNELVTAFRKSMTWIPDGQKVNWNPLRPLMQLYYSKMMDNYIRKVLRDRKTKKVSGVRSRNLMDLAIEKFEEQQRSSNKGESVRGTSQYNDDFEQVAIDNLKTFIFAGHDTSSSAIAYIYHLLAKHPEALQLIREEHNTVFGEDPSRAASLLKDEPSSINVLPYTTAVIKETMRLYPAAGSLRSPEKPTTIEASTGNSVTLKPGSLVWISVHSIHHRPDLWPCPDEFHPERFLEANHNDNTPGGWKGHVPPKDGYRPFEKGPRNCIGQELAMIEMKVVLALTVRSFGFSEAFDEWETMHGSGESGPVKEAFDDKAYQVFSATAKPKSQMPMRVTEIIR